MGLQPASGHEIEAMLANWIRGMAKRGFPINKTDLVVSVKQIVKEMNIDTNFINGNPGRKWTELFLKRQ